MKIRNIRPIGDLVYILREQIKEEGGVALPEPWNYKMHGVVQFVGPGSDTINGGRVPMQVKVGDTVLCPPNLTPIPADPLHPKRGEVLFFCRQGQLIGVLCEDESGNKDK